MKTIVIDARELRTSSGRYVERLLHYLQKIDHEHQYKVLLKPNDMAGWQPSNPNFQAVACPHKEFTLAEQFGLLQQLRSLQPDLVHFAFPQQPTLYSGKTITTIHDLTTLRFSNPDKNALVFAIKQRVYARVILRAARRSAHVLTGSGFVKRDIVQFAHIDPAKITVTYEAADPIPDSPEPVRSLMGKTFLMYVGRPTPHKNLERLIAAFGIAQKHNPKLHLVLAGKLDANYRRIQAATQQQGLKNIVFTDFVTEGQLRWLYEECAAYVFPSLSEGFGLPGLEAMQHRAPVISSDATCLPEIYGDAACYFNPLDVAEMAECIERVVNDAALREKLVQKGAARVKDFSWQRTAEQTLEAYRAVLT